MNEDGVAISSNTSCTAGGGSAMAADGAKGGAAGFFRTAGFFRGFLTARDELATLEAGGAGAAAAEASMAGGGRGGGRSREAGRNFPPARDERVRVGGSFSSQPSLLQVGKQFEGWSSKFFYGFESLEVLVYDFFSTKTVKKQLFLGV